MVHRNGPPLVLHGDSLTIPGQRVLGRDTRHWLKSVQRGHTQSISGRLCFLPVRGGPVAVSVGSRLIAHVSGVAHCGSPWSCPVCSPVIGQRRAEEIEGGLAVHVEAGGSALFVTFSGSHFLGERLAPLLAMMVSALRLTLQGRSWVELRDGLDYVGSIRAVEVTYTRNGWHPHTHAALLFGRPLSPVEIESMRSLLFRRWQSAMRRHGFRDLHPVHGVDVRPVSTAAGLGEYMAKEGSKWGVGMELARPDLKDRSSAPLQLLASFAHDGDLDALGLWLEYEGATFGKKRIVWSRGLKARLLVGPEVTDEEAATAEGVDVVLVEVVVLGDDWRLWVESGLVGELLTRIEETAALFLLMASFCGEVRRLRDG